MKKVIICALLLLGGSQLLAQRAVELTESVSSSQEVFLHFKFADNIKLIQWDRNEAKVEASVQIDDGEGNEYFSLKTKEMGSELKVYSDFGEYFEQKRKKDNWCNHETEIDYVVYIPRNAEIEVKSISGSVESDRYNGSLRTDLVSGDVTIKNYSGDLRLKTVSGDLDVTMNKAKIDARTVTGTIYSDLDIDMKTKNGKSYGGNKVLGTVNGGSELIVLNTVSGNIYMRKG
ncbi:hypothetical protein POV27_02895 [Aureisphaera galaxeae]|uniref:DUF4097 family beta strand repeat-containing protein n=1 Tax=Aureisphaera galaxeae TaxID=1538023 RepID=UPI00235076BB|nr:DUF4097 family beta strand repeat-containing protein [Aureisphaera galaxeae]MDC8002980.1 hypothetical protein [Aureisphaera galaxeae]